MQAELTKAGIAVNNNLCPHFAMSRVDLYNVVMSVSFYLLTIDAHRTAGSRS